MLTVVVTVWPPTLTMSFSLMLTYFTTVQVAVLRAGGGNIFLHASWILGPLWLESQEGGAGFPLRGRIVGTGMFSVLVMVSPVMVSISVEMSRTYSVTVWVGASVVRVSNTLTIEVASTPMVTSGASVVRVSPVTIVEVLRSVDTALCEPETLLVVVLPFNVVVFDLVTVVSLVAV